MNFDDKLQKALDNLGEAITMVKQCEDSRVCPIVIQDILYDARRMLEQELLRIEEAIEVKE